MNVALMPCPFWAWTWMVRFRSPMDPCMIFTVDGFDFSSTYLIPVIIWCDLPWIFKQKQTQRKVWLFEVSTSGWKSFNCVVLNFLCSGWTTPNLGWDWTFSKLPDFYVWTDSIFVVDSIVFATNKIIETKIYLPPDRWKSHL